MALRAFVAFVVGAFVELSVVVVERARVRRQYRGVVVSSYVVSQ
ncbi:hypothetical protein ACXZ9C_10520 [Streptococcus agalactiae]